MTEQNPSQRYKISQLLYNLPGGCHGHNHPSPSNLEKEFISRSLSLDRVSRDSAAGVTRLIAARSLSTAQRPSACGLPRVTGRVCRAGSAADCLGGHTPAAAPRPAGSATGPRSRCSPAACRRSRSGPRPRAPSRTLCRAPSTPVAPPRRSAVPPTGDSSRPGCRVVCGCAAWGWWLFLSRLGSHLLLRPGGPGEFPLGVQDIAHPTPSVPESPRVTPEVLCRLGPHGALLGRRGFSVFS